MKTGRLFFPPQPAVRLLVAVLFLAITSSASVPPVAFNNAPPTPIVLDRPPTVLNEAGTELRYEEWRDGPLPIYPQGDRMLGGGISLLDTTYDLPNECQAYNRFVVSTFNFETGFYNLVLLDGCNRISLSNGYGNDIYPRLGHVANRVVFTSSRNGNFEIYAVNVDGTGFAQLTNHPATDTLPNWSPDGSKIVFTSARDGNFEIYVMNANGSGQTRITNTPGYDEIYPVWSPDGSQLAWVQRVPNDPTGNGSIWIANADGSGATKILDNLKFLSRLDWRPDYPILHGSDELLIFSHDYTGNGWFDISIFPLDGSASQPIPELLAGTLSDFDIGGWVSNAWPEYTFTLMRYVNFEGTLYILSSTTEFGDTRWEGWGEEHYAGTIYDRFPHWMRTDQTPPVSRFAPLPPYTKVDYAFHTHPVYAWDNAPYNIHISRQYRAGIDGNWALLWPSTNNTLTLGIPYYFRSQASDSAGNVEPEHLTPHASTIVYFNNRDWQFFDNRVFPVGNIEIDPGASSFGHLLDSSGLFGAYAFSQNLTSFEAAYPQSVTKALSFNPQMEYPLTVDYFVPTNNIYPDLEPEKICTIGAGISQIDQQTVSIPADMHAPTLTWIQQLDFSSATHYGLLSVFVEDNGEEFSVYSSLPSLIYGEITVGWVDLTPWSGETVDIIFKRIPQPGPIPGQVCLSDVSVGSWYTPVLLDIEPSHIEVDSTEFITLDGLNFISGASVYLNDELLSNVNYIDESTLEVALPAELPPGLYTISVVNPAGQTSPYSQMLIVGHHQFLSVIWR